jgi:predicted RNA-binding Zn-ribbon protein involved in translation (DUF1610 family)
MANRKGKCTPCKLAFEWDTKAHDTVTAKSPVGRVWAYRMSANLFPCPQCGDQLTTTSGNLGKGRNRGYATTNVEWQAYPDAVAVEAPPTPEPEPVAKPTPTRKPKTGKSFSDRLDANVASTAPMITEIERLVRLSLHDLAKLGLLGEDWDLDKFRILVTMEPPKNGSSPTKLDREALGHFTLTNTWTDSAGVTYRQININPYMLDHFGGSELFRTCYHEAIHAANEYRSIIDCASNGKHNKKFAEAVDESGVLVAEKRSDYVGWSTPTFTAQGEKLVKKVKPLAPSFARILPPSKAKKVGPKRVTLQCPECEMKAGVPVGVFTKNLERVLENLNVETNNPIDMPEHMYPVMTCSADGSGMMPPESWKL